MRLMILATLTLTIFGQAGLGQEERQKAIKDYQPAESNSRQNNAYPASRATQVISVDFPGGTIGDYIDLVKKDADSLNLIVTDGAKDLVLPKIALKNVPVDVAVNCIEQCFDPSETVVKVSNENRGIQIIQATNTSQKEVDVINVKRLFNDGKLTEETFMQAIEIGLAMYSQKEKLKLKIQFHKETGLLFLSGLRQEIQLVQQVVDQLQNNSFGPGGMMGGNSVGLGGMTDRHYGGPGSAGGSDFNPRPRYWRDLGMGDGGMGAGGMGAGEGSGTPALQRTQKQPRNPIFHSNRESLDSGGGNASGNGGLGAGPSAGSGGSNGRGPGAAGGDKSEKGDRFGGNLSGGASGGRGLSGGGGSSSGGGASGGGNPFRGR